MYRLIVAAALSVALFTPTVALAAPITCPAGQDAEKVGTVWECVNNGGHGDPQTEESRNPNDKVLNDYAIGLIDETLARAEKVGLCHWSEDEDKYIAISIPVKQIMGGKRAHGHTNHEHDRLVPDGGCESLPSPEPEA
jgi:hypothetical protein